MALINISQFAGEIPRRNRRLLAPNQAQIAENCDVLSGSIVPFKIPSDVETLSGTDFISLYRFEATGEFLVFETDVDFIRSPVALDTFQRVYSTGENVPKVRGINTGTEFLYDLGIPKPTLTPTGTPTAQSSTTWTRTFHYFYEEPDGTRVDEDASALTVIETTPGVVYTVDPIPAKIAASADAFFVLWFDAFDPDGTTLGRLYPATSAASANNDFVLGGATASSALVVVVDVATLTISFDTSRSSEFTVDRSYVYTLVSGEGEEGAPSDPSLTVIVQPDEAALIANMDTAVVPNRNITLKRIYRTVTDTTGATNFKFVAEIPYTQATFSDQVLDADTGELLSTADFFPPPTDMQGIVLHPGGFAVGFTKNTIHPSPPFQPHAYPTGNQLSVEYDIIALGISGNSIVILTDGYGYIATGDSPETLTLRRIESRQPCVSKRGTAQIKDMVIYPSADGLVGVQGANAQLLTEEYFRRDDWQLVQPSTMVGEVHDKRYIGFADGRNIVFDFDEGASALVRTTVNASGVWSDLELDELFIIVGNKIQKWRGGSANLPVRWKSFERRYDRQISFSTIKLEGGGNSPKPSLNIYANNVSVQTLTFPDDDARRIPNLRNEKFWALEVLTLHEVNEIAMATSVAEIRDTERV